jgi:hypothetical protein
MSVDIAPLTSDMSCFAVLLRVMGLNGLAQKYEALAESPSTLNTKPCCRSSRIPHMTPRILKPDCVRRPAGSPGL